jgi:two-component system sensor histidine kinase PilS (NtrC family)
MNITASSAPALMPPPVQPPLSQDASWRSLLSFSVYRVVMIIVLAIAYWGFQRFQVVATSSANLAASSLTVYFLLALLMFAAVRRRVSSLSVLLTIQVAIDISCLTLLMHASGGVKSGIGILLLVSLAASGLIARGRMTYFHAAIAALAVLFEQSFQFLYLDALASDFLQSGLLAGSYFVIAGLGYTLAKYATGVERIAEARGLDLANLAQINELVIRDMQDGFIVVDERGIIRQHNPQSAAMISGLIGRAPLAQCAPQLAAMLEDWRHDHGRVFPMVRDARTQTDYQVRFVAIGHQNPSPTVLFIEDAGRIRSQAQQMKLVALGRLTASIAHEIRNPLSSINHAAELLQEDVQRSTGDARLLDIIRENSHRLDRMVQEVLYLNRRDRAQPELIEARAYLEQFARDFSANEKVPAKVITLELETDTRMVFDRSHLDQVLWNLTRNACRHGTGAAGSVRISLRQRVPMAMLELTVVDDGPGVSTEALPHLFEPFFTTDSKGTGLGLYIARELAEVNGARIDYVPYDGGEAGRGARFRITMKSEQRNP